MKCSNYKYFRFIVLLSIICFITLHPCKILSQAINLGTPKLEQFSPEKYKAGTQNWRLDISNQGILYVANNNGLLSFDGERWQIHRQPNKTICRSVKVATDGKIYVGGQDEMGYFDKDNEGKLTYYSLLQLIPEEYQNFEDIWQIEAIDNSIYFRNNYSLFRFKNNVFEIVAKDITCDFISILGNEVFFNQRNHGIFKIKTDGSASIIKGTKQLSAFNIIAFLPLDDESMIILTEKNGIYSLKDNALSIWKSNAQEYFIQSQITTGIKLKDGRIAIGTRLGGLVILNSKGQAVFKIDKSSGLQNNAINSIIENEWGNLWVGTYYGIDKVNLSESLNLFYPDGALEGAIYDIEVWKNHWWFGTANGLYSLPYQKYYNPFYDKAFKLVPGTSGQVWALDLVADQLFLAHHNGSFQINGTESISKLGKFEGAWKHIKLPFDKMAIGTYSGVRIFKKKNKSWEEDFIIEGLNESSRIMMTDEENHLWVSHPYRGIFKVDFNDQYTSAKVVKYDSYSGYSAEFDNYIFEVAKLPYITNPSGIYRYDKTKNTFIVDEILNNLLAQSGSVRRFFSNESQIWYITDKETGQINIKNEGLGINYELIRYPALNGFFVAGFENLFVQNEQNLLLCTNRGALYHHRPDTLANKRLSAFVQSLHLTQSDSLIHVSSPAEEIILASDQNAFRLSFRTNGKTNAELKGYQYRLEGLEENWSTMSTQPFKDYSNLSHGTYSFQLKVTDLTGNQSEINTLSIRINAPWYLTYTAKVVYTLLGALSIVFLLLIPQKKHQKTLAVVVNKQKETEKEMETIKQEKLRNEIAFKNQELASSTLHLLQKNQTLNSVRDKMEEIQNNIKNEAVRKELKNIVSLLRSDLRLEDDWDRFSMHFDQVHHDFIRKLKQNYPQLSTNDHKLCAYLKMNLSTKEMAPLLNISIRGVEISRYRLRKKLNLARNINLNEFFTHLS